MFKTSTVELRQVASGARASRTVTADPTLIPDDDQSPIQQLPAELLEAIFQTISSSPGDYSSQPQWVLRQVCRFWRNVSTSSPRLWRELYVNAHMAAKLRDATSLLWLALSYTKEMDLVITFDMSASVHGDPALTLLDLLMTRSRQWRTVHFISLDVACTRALTRVRGSLPRLRELHIESTPDARVYEEIVAFTQAPLLEGLYLNGARMDCQSLYAQLTRFSVTGATYRSSLVSVLRECPRLEHMTMQSRAPSFKRVVSQTLKALTFWSTPSDLALVHLPNLRHLDIRGFLSHPPFPLSSTLSRVRDVR
ncbi:hypothetical protein BDZ89DRAFT_252750 [Hymenopellis radicata]|nr:hypothetical protein BDZ89DRAFT_252750 [Hymenopellis radicata]